MRPPPIQRLNISGTETSSSAVVGEVVVADRERQPDRLGPDRARLVDEHAAGRLQAAREVGRGVGRADADEADLAVAQLARGVDRHQLLGGDLDGGVDAHAGTRSLSITCSRIQSAKRSRSRAISSHAS